jgi:hypothetical protein
MRCLQPRSFSQWQSAALPTGLGIAPLHCAITGPLFLIAAVVFLLSDVRMAHVNSLLVWPFVLIGVGIAFLLEWRYAQRSAS